jgi:hypothetical protein
MYYSLYYLVSLLGLVFLSVVYGSLLHAALQWLFKKRWPAIYTCTLVLAGLLIWQNSYWGKKSGPEYERIPLGNQLEIRKRGENPYVSELIDQDKKIWVHAGNFIKSGEYVYGETAGNVAGAYFVLHIPSRQFTLLSTDAYDKQVEQAGFPGRDQLRPYKENWEGHWGNRFVALLY